MAPSSPRKLRESHSQSLPTEHKDYLPSCSFDLHGQCIQISTRLQNSSHHHLLCAQEDISAMGHREAKQLRTQKPPAGAWQAERAVCQSSLAEAQHRHSPQGPGRAALQGSPLTPTQQMTRGTHSTAQSIRRANSPSSESVQGWAAHTVFPWRNSLGRGRAGGQVLQSFPHGTGSCFAIRKGVCKAHRTGRT